MGQLQAENRLIRRESTSLRQKLDGRAEQADQSAVQRRRDVLDREERLLAEKAASGQTRVEQAIAQLADNGTISLDSALAVLRAEEQTDKKNFDFVLERLMDSKEELGLLQKMLFTKGGRGIE